MTLVIKINFVTWRCGHDASNVGSSSSGSKSGLSLGGSVRKMLAAIYEHILFQTVNVNTINSLPKIWHDDQNANIGKKITHVPRTYTLQVEINIHVCSKSKHIQRRARTITTISGYTGSVRTPRVAVT